MSQDQDEQNRRNLATMGALIVVGFCAFGLLGLMALVIPDILWILAVFVGLGVIGLIQYVTWGWMLDKKRIHDEDDE